MSFDENSAKRQRRVLLLMESLGAANLLPIGVVQFHAFAYLCNALAPVWEIAAFDGSVLKRRGGPFYPDIQHDVDRLVGLGMIAVTSVSHQQDDEGSWFLVASYSLASLARRALDVLAADLSQARVRQYIAEVAMALSAFSEVELAAALSEDATYGNPEIGMNAVVDFAEWDRLNPIVNVTKRLDKIRAYTPGEKLHLYIRRLRQKAVQ